MATKLLVAKSTRTTSAFTLGDRVFHQKFGNVTSVDGNKLTTLFDRAGEKRVVDSLVERVRVFDDSRRDFGR